MMQKSDLLELETRRMIYNNIFQHPGLHIRELCRKLQIPKSSLNYHLIFLEKNGLLCFRYDGRYARYYPVEGINEADKKILGVLRQKVPRKIVLFLMTRPYSSRSEICEYLKKRPSTISFHLKKLVNVGIVEYSQKGRELTYLVYSDGLVVNLLIRYDKSLLDNNSSMSVLDFLDKTVSDYCIDRVIEVGWDIFPHPYHV